MTFIPRVLPIAFLKGRKVSPRIEAFLGIIPYSSLSILTIRTLLTADVEMFLPTLLGIGVAVLVSYVSENISLTIISAIAVAFFWIKLV